MDVVNPGEPVTSRLLGTYGSPLTANKRIFLQNPDMNLPTHKRQEKSKEDRLKDYRKKRHFGRTGEPKGRIQKSSSGRMFVVQKHAARRLHYDLRLEAGGVLKSWAVPKGPSYDPAEKRLAVQVEDHPIEYGDFEGQIEKNQYGAGTVMVWDRGTWAPKGDWETGLKTGKLEFYLDGQKLKGLWALIRFKGKREADSRNWLLIKSRDEEAKASSQFDVAAEEPASVKTGRSLEEIRAQIGTIPGSQTFRESRDSRKKRGFTLPVKARKSSWPHSFSPQLATLVSRVPEDDHWLHEIKFDGYRLIAWAKEGRVSLITRRGQDWTEKFHPIPEELSRLSIKNGILDGEIVVQNLDGTTNFQRLQNILNRQGDGSLLYYVFDLPYLNDHDLAEVPLVERKTVLKELISRQKKEIPSIQYSDHVIGSGIQVFQKACSLGAEGIISKRVDSPYVQRRSKHWVKVKCIKRQEFVVGGFTDPKGSRSSFGSLLLGFYDGNRLIYCGRVGTGLDRKSIKAVYDRLTELEQDRSSYTGPIGDLLKRNVHWTSPELVVEVKFSSRTEGGILRHPSFVGIREDKDPRKVTWEREIVPPEGGSPSRVKARKRSDVPSLFPVRLTHPDKVLYPELGLTKKELAEYYVQIAGWILPELVDRPLVLLRCPDGVQGECFFQKHLKGEMPEWVKAIPIIEKKEENFYPVVENLNGLLSLVQLDTLEIHTWGCRRNELEYPDRMVFDLDPSPEVSIDRLIEATLFLRKWFLKNQIRPFLKTTGGKGIHIVIPLKRSLSWDEVKKTSKAIAQEVAAERPDLFTATMTKRWRKGRILVDYFRNNRGSTSILPYSTRARPGASVALPISEEDLTVEFMSHPLNVRQAIQRLRKLKKDPWQGLR